MLATVQLDQTTMNFAHLVGQEVVIDGERYRCYGIEYFTHAAPWLQGETIGLIVEAARANDGTA
jgi:hypothetical protein